MSQETQITCPNCNVQININEVFAHELKKEMHGKLQHEISQQREKHNKAIALLVIKEQNLKAQKAQFNKQLEIQLNEQLKIKTIDLKQTLKQELVQEQSSQIRLMKEELDEKSMKLQELNRTKAEIEQLKRINVEMEERIKLEAQQSLTQQLEVSKAQIVKTFTQQNELKLKEKEKQLSDLKDKLDEARRKAEQGSQQAQGEVQELAIEEWLTLHFPFDNVEEIKKGIRGADCLQIIHTREIQNCGTIYYESKRTKDFQKSWIEKFKTDMREKGADIGILVTEVLPKDLERLGLVDGVWICTYEEFKALCFVLRENIIKVAHTLQSQENKSDKMSLLYNYLTSNEFKMQIEAIVEGFTQMKCDLDSEKRALGRIWKQREKQIQKVLDNTIGMYGSIKGIAGNSISSIPALELGK